MKNGWRFESVAGKLDGRRGAKKPLTEGCKVKLNIGDKVSCFYENTKV